MCSIILLKEIYTFVNSFVIGLSCADTTRAAIDSPSLILCIRGEVYVLVVKAGPKLRIL